MNRVRKPFPKNSSLVLQVFRRPFSFFGGEKKVIPGRTENLCFRSLSLSLDVCYAKSKRRKVLLGPMGTVNNSAVKSMDQLRPKPDANQLMQGRKKIRS